MAILHIYVARAIFLLFYDDQDTENELRGIEISTYKLIFTHKNISKSILDYDTHTLKMGETHCDNSSYLWN